MIKTPECLDLKERKKIRSLLSIYRNIDQQIHHFKKVTGMECLTGCGHCCVISHIEATVLELIPFAAWAFAQGQGGHWLEKAQQQMEDLKCVFYKEELGADKGHCGIYPLRPLICRLFGFSVNKDKHQQNRLVGCKLINRNHSQAVKKAQDFIRKRTTLLTMHDYTMQVWNLDPPLSQKRMPINEAVKQALEHIGLKYRYASKNPRVSS